MSLDPLDLRLLSLLQENASLSNAELAERIGLSASQCSRRRAGLEEAGYIECTKSFEGRVPRTEYRLTAAGRQALERYLDHMEALITATRERA